MADLLLHQAIRIGQRKGVPLFMEFTVPSDTAPYLVTSTTSLVWVEQAFPGSVVRAAIRSPAPKGGDLNLAIVQAVCARGRENSWGNIQPLTGPGLLEALAHLRYYGLEQIEVLVPEDWNDEINIPDIVQVSEASWLPSRTLVLIPRDRSYLGFLGRLDRDGILAVVHNASRAMAVITDD